MIKIAPSILSADFAALGEAVRKLQGAGADYIHVDIMDGHFVPNITFGPGMVKALRKETTLPLDVHLMIEHPDQYIDSFIEAGADILTIHAESTIHLQRTLSAIKSKKIKAGVSLNPSTPIQAMDYIWNDIDMVLIMTVNPGFGGQKFIPAMYEKIASIKGKVNKIDREIDIEVDGGVTSENVNGIIRAGANIIVAGSAVFNTENQKEMIDTLRGSLS